MGLIAKKVILSCLAAYALSATSPAQAAWFPSIARFSSIIARVGASCTRSMSKSVAVVASAVAATLGILSWKLWKKNKEMEDLKAENRASERELRWARSDIIKYENALNKRPQLKDASTQTNQLAIAIERGNTEDIYNLVLEGEEMDIKQTDEAIQNFRENFFKQWKRERALDMPPRVVTVRVGNALALAHAPWEDSLSKEAQWDLCRPMWLAAYDKILRADGLAKEARKEAIKREIGVLVPTISEPLIKTIVAYSSS